MYTRDLFDLGKSIAGPCLMLYTYPWEMLAEWGGHIRRLGASLPPERYACRGEDIWIAHSATVAASAEIAGPCIIDEEAEFRVGAFLRGNVVVGKRAVVGNSTELKNALLFDGVQVPHYNYVGDSVLGYRAHLGAGAITSNVKGDGSVVVIKHGRDLIPTGRRKCGAMIGDGVEIGCGTVLNPGTVIGVGTQIYPLCSVRGVIPREHIYKRDGTVVPRRKKPWDDCSEQTACGASPTRN